MVIYDLFYLFNNLCAVAFFKRIAFYIGNILVNWKFSQDELFIKEIVV